MIRDSDDKEWQALKDKVRKRDKTCRFLSILTPVERVYFDKSNPTQKHLDCAHVFPVSTHPLMVYNEDNVYLLCREAHHRIDDFLKIFHRKTFFNNERKRQIFRFCATHRNIIYRSENCQFANVSAFKKNRRNHKAIGRKR